MSNISFRCPRRLDRQVIESLKKLAAECAVPGPQLYFIPFEGSGGVYVPFDRYEENAILKEILALNTSGLAKLEVVSKEQPSVGHWHLLKIHRTGGDLVDQVLFEWKSGHPSFGELQFAKLLGAARNELKELRLDEAFTSFPNDQINRYYEARDATLTRLESVTTELLFRTQRRLTELDQEFERRVEKLNGEVDARREELKTEFEVKESALRERADALQKRESDFDTRESKFLRRQLRKDMLERLANLSQKFELTKGTRNLRWPVAGSILVFLAFFGTMTVMSFTQTSEIIKAAGQDLTKLNWWQVGLLSLKQVGFAAAFLAGAWFFIKWSDRWFRQHADTEFMFKQLELDINRASWVVEMALEWKEEKGRELPPELLDRLTRNLFKGLPQDSDKDESPPDLASVLIGSASGLKLKLPSGGEMELDRKGLRDALRKTEA